MRLNKRVKKLWVDALRSGDYKQGKYVLRDIGNSFCCLGVLCNIHAMEHPEIAARESLRPIEICGIYKYINSTTYPPLEVSEWASLLDNLVVEINGKVCGLPRHNDEGATFLEIANAIEEQL